LDGKRIPRKDGEAHTADLPSGNMPGPEGNEDGKPWTLTEAPFESAETAAANADFLRMEGHIKKTGGSGYQFAGETNLGRVAGSLIGLTKFRLYSAIGVAVHGKGMSDAIGYLIKLMVQECVGFCRLLLQGTRNHALYLAQHHRRPTGDVESSA
jgi:hypothetical protein